MTKSLQTKPPVFRELALIGGHPALDFLNTVKYRGGDDPQDKLTSLSAIIEWAKTAGVLTVAEANKLARQAKKTASATRVHREICAFREAARTLFETTRPKGVRYTRAAQQVESAVSALRPVATINRESGELVRHIEIRTAADLTARIVATVAELLTERAKLRIKKCDGDRCDWLFVDRTKAGRRQWCDTRTCGNTARVRRFRLKNQGAVF